MQLDICTGRIDTALWRASPNFDERDAGNVPEVVIVHCISLPPGQYGGGEISRFFQNALNENEHQYFKSMSHLTVSSHFLIDRKGVLTQFVDTNKRAWHAGESICLERPKVNNFSIGIELEGWDLDTNGYPPIQYQRLAELCICLMQAYPGIKPTNVFSHSDIAPGRKPDPGPHFDWPRFLSILEKLSD